MPTGRPGCATRAPASRLRRSSPATSSAPGHASSSAARPSRQSATRKSSRSASAGTRSPPQSATTRSSSSRARPARARPPSCPRSAWSWAAASPGRSATPSRAGSPRAPSPSGSPRSSAAELGEAVGYNVRFTDKAATDTLVKLMTDGILLAEMQHDRDAAPLRHDDHRRGARAQPEHRLPARLPPPAAAPPPRPEGHHHLGDDRPRALLRALRRRTAPPRWSRCPAALTRSRSATAPSTRTPATAPDGRRDADPDRDQVQAIGDAIDELLASGPATSWCSCPASGRSATPPRRSSGRSRPLDVLPLYARLSSAEQHRVFGCPRSAAAAASCWPRTSPRPR